MDIEVLIGWVLLAMAACLVLAGVREAWKSFRQMASDAEDKRN